MRVISGAVAGLPEGYYGRVAHYRHRVFVEQLGWRLQVQDGAEIDQFDRPDTVYVMLVEDKKAAHAKSLDIVRSDIEKTLRVQQQDELSKQWIDGLRKKTFVVYFQ